MQHATDYRHVIAGFTSGEYYDKHEGQVWDSVARFFKRNLRLVFWYWLLVVVVALTKGFLVLNYARILPVRWLAGLVDRMVLSGVPEWHTLLTNFVFQDKRTLVLGDVLATDDTLYSGTISNYFLTKEGSLSGLMLDDPSRFDRRSYLNDRDAGIIRPRQSYWHRIPSERLYLFADKILNINLHYKIPAGTPESEVVAIQQLVSDQLGPQAGGVEIDVKLGITPEDVEREQRGVF